MRGVCVREQTGRQGDAFAVVGHVAVNPRIVGRVPSRAVWLPLSLKASPNPDGCSRP